MDKNINQNATLFWSILVLEIASIAAKAEKYKFYSRLVKKSEWLPEGKIQNK